MKIENLEILDFKKLKEVKNALCEIPVNTVVLRHIFKARIKAQEHQELYHNYRRNSSIC